MYLPLDVDFSWELITKTLKPYVPTYVLIYIVPLQNNEAGIIFETVM
jgi:hypothetical protein